MKSLFVSCSENKNFIHPEDPSAVVRRLLSLRWYWECVDLFVGRLAFQASRDEPAVVLGGVGSTAIRPSVVDTSQVGATVANRAESAFT